ncbi:MAG TPA: hypothetical protein VFJ16_09935 [Longimicrobium sp.]|nr:hypothetical protein [Longimicrobium sp.]
MKRNLVLATLLALAATAAPAAAQIRIPPVTLIAGVGKAAEANYAAYLNESGMYQLEHGSSPVVQLGLETPSGIRGVDVRLGVTSWKPMARLEEGSTSGGGQGISRTRMKTLTLDANVHLPRVLDAHPYLLAGGALVRSDFNETYYHDSNQPFTPSDHTTPALHLGGGIAWNVGRYDLFVEGSTYISAHHQYAVEGYKLKAGGNASLTAGFRIPLKR